MSQEPYISLRYSIKDLERISGIKAHTLRIWEQRYQLLVPERTDSNIRYYNNDDLRKILNVALLNNNGVKISRIATMSSEELRREVIGVLNENTTGEQQYIQALILAMVNLDEVLFDDTMTTAMKDMGLANVIVKVCYPFLERIGVMWQVGTITPAQEHFISYLIRQKVIVAIDALGYRRDPNQKTFVLFLPQNELHEIGLLVYHYLIKKSGANVIYLGTAVPIEDLVQVCQLAKPETLVTQLTYGFETSKLKGYLQLLSDKFPDKTILIGGMQMNTYAEELPSNMIRMAKATDLISYLEK